ncbi:hypothetical protein LCGC14_0313580 [marine sediment metagenome]|uniref:Uncharacterized protein n=1 Tax=marine sediment metagenome TaxID=412755 RepID=A0A0F9W8T3_9ZZZZ
MAKVLTAVSYRIEKVEPQINTDNQVIGYLVEYNVRYENLSAAPDDEGNRPGHQARETEDLWLVAPQPRKDEVQAIQDLIKQRLDNTILG